MKDRIKLLMEDQHLTQQSFAQLLEISPAQLSGIYNGRTKPTLNIVDAIHRKFPQVRIEWLLYGLPPMYVSDATSVNGESTTGMVDQSGITGLAFDFKGEDNEEDTSSGPLTPNNRQPSTPQMLQGSLFEQAQMHGVNKTPKNIEQEDVKEVYKKQRKITEIRVFYDDQTWETFVPKK